MTVAPWILPFLLRILCWIPILIAILVVQFQRSRLDMLELKAGTGQLTLYLMPSAIGFEYFPEVYRSQILGTRSLDYLGIPFDGIPERDDSKDYHPASYSGFFLCHYLNNGGPHWTISCAVPLWLLGLLVATGMAFTIRIPKFRMGWPATRK